MSGSFNQRRVADIIRVSQTEWRTGYDLGKKRQGCGNRSLDTFSRAFREGYRRGYDESLGKKSPEVKQAPPRMSPVDEEKAQRERARHLAKRDPDIPEIVLEKCHPAFREEYHKYLRQEEEALDYRWRDDEHRDREF